jgi:hypothetical protein
MHSLAGADLPGEKCAQTSVSTITLPAIERKQKGSQSGCVAARVINQVEKKERKERKPIEMQ